MRNLSKLALLSLGFIAIGLSTITTGLTSTPVFADSEKNQKLSPKTECEVDTDIRDHNKHTIVGPIDLQCNSTNSNIRDSTVIQNLPSNGDFGSPTAGSTDPSDGDNNVPVDLSEIKVTFDEKIRNSSSTSLCFASACSEILIGIIYFHLLTLFTKSTCASNRPWTYYM